MSFDLVQGRFSSFMALLGGALTLELVEKGMPAFVDRVLQYFDGSWSSPVLSFYLRLQRIGIVATPKKLPMVF